MSENSLTESSGDKEFSRHAEAWQGLFLGFVEASRRDHKDPGQYLRTGNISIGPKGEHLVEFTVRPVFVDQFTGFPSVLLVTVDKEGLPKAQASGEVEWIGERAKLKRVMYIPHKGELGLTVDTFPDVIRDLGGAFEQPSEY